jgi:hypothetical protein
LTADDIQRMSMEEYALVRGFLLDRVRGKGLEGVKRF